jgi:hypothetical protein
VSSRALTPTQHVTMLGGRPSCAGGQRLQGET